MVAHKFRLASLLAVLATYALIFSSFHLSYGTTEENLHQQQVYSLDLDQHLATFVSQKTSSFSVTEKSNAGGNKVICLLLGQIHFHSIECLTPIVSSLSLGHLFVPYLHGIMPQAP